MMCASCGSLRVYPSRLRNIYERLREALTGRQPHRCHQCGHRRWMEVEILAGTRIDTRPDDLRTAHHTTPVKPNDLDELDPLRLRR
jgi:DNA-directed RNA polymerase subunit RPC12/RpoP